MDPTDRPRHGLPAGLQRVLALCLLVLALPLLLGLAVAVVLDDPGPPVYVARRMGRGGRPFRLFKLRTMRRDAAITGPGLSLASDPRVTRIGAALRRMRLDEVPQLWNVVRGDMLLIGPRPEDPRYLEPADPLHAAVLAIRPGITGVTQLAYAREGDLLDASDPERHYREVLLPAKLRMDLAYLRARSLSLDLWILRQTLLTAAGHPPSTAAIRRRCPALDEGLDRTV